MLPINPWLKITQTSIAFPLIYDLIPIEQSLLLRLSLQTRPCIFSLLG